MKRLLTLLLALSLAVLPVRAASQDAASAASELHTLGVFHGVGYSLDGTPDYDLDRGLTRAEAVTMVVRLMGREDAARLNNFTTPFLDVPAWAEPYVGYACVAGVAGGYSPQVFGSGNPVTYAEFLTFLLRALGYQEGTDFVWNSPWELAQRVGITRGYYHAGTNRASFTRGDAAVLSYNALSCSMKDHTQSLRAQMEQNIAEIEAAF